MGARPDNSDDFIDETGSWDATPPPIPAPPGVRELSGDDPTLIPPRETGAAAASDRARKLPRIDGYEVVDILGHGGMGVVYRARQIKLNRTVALKMVLASEHASPKTLRRLMLEAEAAASLGHPHIVQIFELGQHDGQPYFSMEFVDGAPLSAAHPNLPRDVPGITDLFIKIADAVHAAHLRGIIHRDLKPPNVLLTWAGEPKITDFGLAKRLDSGVDLTAPGAVLGTPAYMAPEQAAGRAEDVGPATDVHAIGVMLYQMLVGEPPFRGENEHDTLNRVLTREAKWPAKTNLPAPRDLRTICLRCLEKSPSARYASALELADDLRRFRMGDPIRARPIGPITRVARWVKRRRVQSVAALLGVIVAVAAAWGGYHYVGYVRPTSAYFGDFDTRWGAPAIFFEPITEQMRSRRPITYRITRAGWYGRTLRVEAINAAGEIVPDQGMVPPVVGLGFDAALSTAKLIYRYREDGRVGEVWGVDTKNQQTWRCIFTADESPAPHPEVTREIARLINPRGLESAALGGTTTILIERDARTGRDLQIMYTEGRGVGQQAGGAFGRRFAYGEGPRPVADTYLDVHGRPTVAVGGAGYAERRITYDTVGRPIDVSYFDPAGLPMSDRYGIHRQRLDYDDAGNLVRVLLLGPGDARMPHMYGYTETTLVRGNGGLVISEEYRGFDENLQGFSAVQTTRGPDGRLLSVTHVDAAGTPVEKIRVACIGTSRAERQREGSFRTGDVLLAMNEKPIWSVFWLTPGDFNRPARILALRKGEEVELSWPPVGVSLRDMAESKLPK